jgi:hypothetical protein
MRISEVQLYILNAGMSQNGMSSSEISAAWAYSSWPAAAGGRWSKLAAELAELAARP